MQKNNKVIAIRLKRLSMDVPVPYGPGMAAVLLFLVSLSIPALSPAMEWLWPDNSGHSPVIGIVASYGTVDDSETLVDLARRYDLGYNEITLANPDLDPWYPGADAKVTLPTSWILPGADYPDLSDTLIIVNLGELRLYLLDRSKRTVVTFPVGIGRQGFETDPGRYWITGKKKNPYWTIPSTLRDEYPEITRVPPGPSNPLGNYALRLSRNDYLIHGTNKPLGIGRRISHGCMRMYPEDIERLFELVPVGCEVLIVYETVKVGVKGGTPFIEVHPDYLHDNNQHIIARHLLIQNDLWEKVDPFLLEKAVSEKSGIPVPLR